MRHGQNKPGPVIELAVLCLVAWLCMPLSEAAGQVTIRAKTEGDIGRTRFIAFLSKAAEYRIFSVGDPYRIVVDLPEVDIQLPSTPAGLVLSARSGLLAAGKSRIVIDLAESALVEKSELLPPENGLPARLVIDLVRSTHKAFLAQSKAPPPIQRQSENAVLERNPADRRPLIVVDPGHGGPDPGTSGRLTATPEKVVTLAFCQILKQKLEATGQYRIVMTRSTDVFVSLDERAQIAAGQTADLLISIHADMLDEKKVGLAMLQKIRGGTIYTLSETASDEQARILAEQENKADLNAGVGSEQAIPPAITAEIGSILGDLQARGKKNREAALADYLIGHLPKEITFNLNPHRGASFTVLKAAGVPAILFELGYLSNAEDEKLLISKEWQASAAQSLAEAVDAFMRERLPRTPI